MLSFRKLTSVVIILLTCSLVLTGCKQRNPDITTSITLNKITEEEYNKIGNTSKPEGVTINDLKKLYIDVEFASSINAVERKITLSNLYIVDKYDRLRTIGGGTSERNNIGTEDAAESMAYIIFDSRGLSEQDIRSLYSESIIYIAYELKNGQLEEKRISIGDELIFNK